MSTFAQWRHPLAVIFSVSLAILLVWLSHVTLQASASPAKVPLAGTPTVVWPQIMLTTVITPTGQPVFVTHAGDDSGRLFIVDRFGLIRVVKNNTLLATPFLSITDRVESGYSEQGLLSVAFPPTYTTKQHFYVYYTQQTTGDLVLARYGLTGNPDVADSLSETIVLTISHRDNLNHDGGQLQFGPRDGYLYMATGDGGSGGDPPNNAQTHNVLLGKMLRLDVETGNPTTYTIPSSNPFTQTVGYRPEIWALGLRNPWRFSFDRQTGDLYIGDVGQDSREEIDFQAASVVTGGQNFGWSCYEAYDVYRADRCDNQVTYTFPITDYDSSNPSECAVMGGYVYRGAQYVLPRGIYFYADHCSGKIWGLQYDGLAWQNKLLYTATFNISSFGEDEAGNLYVAAIYAGKIYRIDSMETNVFVPLIMK
ncbi:MAG: PQQ-dependent sugar dehydrogenase [Chloroflexota bacterium]